VQTTDLQQGAFRETGRPLDLGLEGQGFLVVRTDRGERLTRGGSFQLDPSGTLTDTHGNPLLGVDGPMVLAGTTVEVQNDGSVMVDGALAGRLRVETVDNLGTLHKEAAGRFIASTPTHPVDEDTTHVRQGAIEEPNLDPLLSMVDLITIQRAYSANVDALKAMDSVLGTVTGEVGRVGP
jgi:flagellar basal body rod protein FlgG